MRALEFWKAVTVDEANLLEGFVRLLEAGSSWKMPLIRIVTGSPSGSVTPMTSIRTPARK